MRASMLVCLASAVGACHAAGGREAAPERARGAPEVVSSVPGVRIVRTDRLPPNPHRAGVDEACSDFAVADPTTAGGRLAAGKGWIVTSETRLGGYDAVTFVGGLDPSTSGTCAHADGNLAVFAGRALQALAYLGRAPRAGREAPAPGADAVAEDSLGSAQQIDPRRIRLSYGLPSAPFADVVLRDAISVEKPADKDVVCGGAAFVPNVFGEDIREARRKLMAYGWRPEKPREAPSGGTLPGGVIETEDCSGTGYGFCAFTYRHPKGFGLSVVSTGEDYSVTGYTASCGRPAERRARR